MTGADMLTSFILSKEYLDISAQYLQWSYVVYMVELFERAVFRQTNNYTLPHAKSGKHDCNIAISPHLFYDKYRWCHSVPFVWPKYMFWAETLLGIYTGL